MEYFIRQYCSFAFLEHDFYIAISLQRFIMSNFNGYRYFFIFFHCFRLGVLTTYHCSLFFAKHKFFPSIKHLLNIPLRIHRSSFWISFPCIWWVDFILFFSQRSCIFLNLCPFFSCLSNVFISCAIHRFHSHSNTQYLYFCQFQLRFFVCLSVTPF